MLYLFHVIIRTNVKGLYPKVWYLTYKDVFYSMLQDKAMQMEPKIK
jgi:hypothetical protein